jgi:hypothetical protein
MEKTEDQYQKYLEELKLQGLGTLSGMQKKAYLLLKKTLNGKEELTTDQKVAIKLILRESQRQLDRLEGKPIQRTEEKHEGEMTININLKDDKK